MKNRLFTCVSLLTGLLYLWLFYQLLFTPAEMLKGFGLAAEPHAIYLAKRISVLMLGFAVLLLLGSRLKPSAARAVIAVAVATNMAGFALNSFWGAANGILTDPAIPLIGGIESVIAVSYGLFAIADFRASRLVSHPAHSGPMV
ncbi:MAG: hypothetical protein IPP19_17015 [Verrucomicrobia bacterium]|nr:hypothetical protein [Verrucomicrobiota bacterium]